MSVLWTMLIVAGMTAAPNEAFEPTAVTLYKYGFETRADDEFDEWPQGWRRRRGPGYPGYLDIEIVDDRPAEGKYCLRAQLNGGAVALFSPPMPADHRSSFVLTGSIRTVGLKNDHAQLSLTYLDKHDQVLERVVSVGVTTAKTWESVKLGASYCANPAVQKVVIGLHLEPIQQRADLNGTVWFDDLVLAVAPRQVIELPDQVHLYSPQQEIPLRCRYLRHVDSNVKVLLTLLDPTGRLVEPPLARITAAKLPEPNVQWSGSLWFKEPGFYRLRVAVADDDEHQHIEETTLAILPDMQPTPRGEFGWTLPKGEERIPLADVTRLLGNVGITRVKFPVWVGDHRERIDELVTLFNSIRLQGVELIALLSQPPSAYQQKLGIRTELNAAKLFQADIQAFAPTIDPLLTRMSWQIAAWQLGDDHDTSLASLPKLIEHIDAIKQHLDRVGYNVTVGLTWNWSKADPVQIKSTDELPWRFVSVSDRQLSSPMELSERIESLTSKQLPRWLSLEPPKSSSEDLSARINDLLERLLLAKTHGMKAIFLHAPIRDQGGLVNTDGSPTELLLPWRTTASLLSGAEYLGQIPLPQGSRNYAFARDSQVVLVLEGSEPRGETLYLGEEVRQINVWGQSITPPINGSRQVVRTEATPVFITGVHAGITRWRLNTRLADRRLPSQFGVRQRSRVLVKNTLGETVVGALRIVPPPDWRVLPERFEIELAPNEETELPISWYVPLNGTSGQQRVQLDFELFGSERYEFSAFDNIEVGLGDLRLDSMTRLNDQGDLVVQQRIVNNTSSPASFRCHLHMPGQPRIRAQLDHLGPGEHTFTYKFPNGRQFIGQTLWIRAEEIGGSRVLSHRFLATEKFPTPASDDDNRTTDR